MLHDTVIVTNHTNMPKPANNGPATDFQASSDGWAAKTIKASYCCN